MKSPGLVIFGIALSSCVAAGPQGAPGPQGPPGDDSDAYRPLFSAACTAVLDLVGVGGVGQDGIEETLLSYNWLVYINGDVEVACEASAGLQSGGFSTFYPYIASGASSAACTVGLDYLPEDGHAGYWRFESVLDGFFVTHKATDTHPLNGVEYQFGGNDCVIRQMSDELRWREISLSELLEQVTP